MARRESVKYSLQYVLSALDALGLDDEDEDVVEETKPATPVVNLLPVVTTLKAIGEINDFVSTKRSKSAPYNLEAILATLKSLGEDDPGDDEWDYTLSRALSDKQLIAKRELEDIVSSLTAFERNYSKNDLQMLLTEYEAVQRPTPAAGGDNDFDLQFVLFSLEALGEEESETESFLSSLNPARKNTLVKCNLQYVISLLNSLGQVESADDYDDWKTQCKIVIDDDTASEYKESKDSINGYYIPSRSSSPKNYSPFNGAETKDRYEDESRSPEQPSGKYAFANYGK